MWVFMLIRLLVGTPLRVFNYENADFVNMISCFAFSWGWSAFYISTGIFSLKYFKKIV